MPKILVGLSIRLTLMAYQLQVVNEKTVKCQVLRRLIEYTVSRKLLGGVKVWGLKGNEIHAVCEISIDYSRTGSRITVSASCPDAALPGSQGTAADTTFPGANGPPQTCPVWDEALDWFTSLCEQRGLWLTWSPWFLDKHKELCEKFGLVASPYTDRTFSAPSHDIPNSVLSELYMTTRFSSELFPEEGETSDG